MTYDIRLHDITKCNASEQHAVRNIRNQLAVRRSMYNEHLISLEEHQDWIKRLAFDRKQIVFIVFVGDAVSGVVSVNSIDWLHKKADWAFYLDENVRGGLGAALEFALINFVFEKLNLEKLNCEVIETNSTVVKLHKKFGFEQEGFRRENIVKDEKRIGVFFLGLTRSDWQRAKLNVYERSKRIIDKFNISIEYE